MENSKQNISTLTFVILIYFFSISPSISYAQTKQQADLIERDSIIVAAKETIKSARYCALITLNSKGLPHVRTMDPFPTKENFIIWFGTNKKSRKVNEIVNNSNVTLYFADPTGGGYVTITGKAKIIDDKKEKAKRWNKEWEAFYPDKDKMYVLIKVIPTQLDVLSYKHGIIGNPFTWRIPHIKF